MNLENKLKELKKLDNVTYEHSVRCGNYLAMLAEACGKDPDTVQTYREAGYAHDLGKMCIMKYVKSTANMQEMSKEEAKKFKECLNAHVKYGESIIKELTDYKKEYRDAANYHHCYYNDPSKGYSIETVKKEKNVTPTKSGIPEVAQMLSVVDVYDALTDPNRQYRQNVLSNEKVEEIMNNNLKNGQFNANYYKTFMERIVPQIKNMTDKEKLVERYPVNEIKAKTHSATFKEWGSYEKRHGILMDVKKHNNTGLSLK